MGKWTGCIALVLGMAVAATALPAAASKLRPPPPAGDVVLAGEIHVAAGVDSDGLLELHLDDTLHATIPAGSGAFEIGMPREGRAGMVWLEFSAPGVRLRSLLGTHARLARAAGVDGRLDAGSEDGLRLTPLSTALAVLATRAAGTPPASDAALATAVAAVEGLELARATAVLARLAADPARLPPGIGDGLALLEDEAAWNDYLADNPDMFADVHEVLDAIPTPPLAAAATGPVLAFAGARQGPGDPIEPGGLVVERDADGYRVHDELFDGPAYDGTLEGGALVLVPQSPVARLVPFGPTCPSTGTPTWEIWTVTGRDFRRHWRGSGLSLWQLGQEHELSYPKCPELPSRTVRWTSLWAATDMVRARALTTPRRFLGRHALPVFCGAPMPHGMLALDYCGHADHVFAADGSGIVHPHDQPSATFAWSRDADGAMRVDYGDAATRFWIVDPGEAPGREVQGVAWVAEGNVVGYDGTASGHAPMLRGGTGVDDDAAAQPLPRMPSPAMVSP